MPVHELSSPVPSSPSFPFVGDALCLDLTNTVVAGVDLLPDFASYVRWLVHAGVLSEPEARTVAKRWGNSVEGAATLDAAKILRETLRNVVQAVLAGRPAPGKILEVLNPLLARSPARAELVRDRDGKFRKRFRLPWREPSDLLAPIAESAADLLATLDDGLIRQCAHPACTLLFHDGTKNHRRRWCSMAVCGNRAKAAAHRARRQAAAP